MKKLLFTTAFFLCATLLFGYKGFDVTFQQPQPSTYDLTFGISDFHLEEVTIDGVTYSKIVYDGSVHTRDKGFAELPFVHAAVMISPDKNIGFQVDGDDYIDYDLDHPLLPSRGIIYRDQDPSAIPYEINPASLVDRWYPESLAQLTDPYIIKDIRGVSVYVYPFRYNAVNHVLRFYRTVHVRLTESGSKPVINPLTKASDHILHEMDAIYRSVFINYPGQRYDLTVGDYGALLVICTARDSDAIDTLIQWKSEKGMVVYKEVVATGTNVKDLVQQKYDEDNNILYVLLVGDWDDVRSDVLNGSSPMDPQLGCVVGNDIYADICVGRFSASSPADVTTQVNKVINYEKFPESGATWYSHAIGIGSDQGPGDDNEFDYQHEDVIYNNKLDPFTYDGYTNIYDPGATSNMVKQAVEEGASILNYTGHGSMVSWGTTGFSNGNVAQLQNGDKLPVIISVACDNGDFQSGECFAEAWLKKQNGGAAMMLAGAISQPWDPPMRGQDYFMDVMTGGYDYSLYPGQNGITTTEGRNTVGSFVFNGLTLMLVESSGIDDQETAKTWTIFGDPSMQMRTSTPADILVSNSNVLVGAPFTTMVTSQGEPVSGSVVALSQDDQVFSGVTDESGMVTIDQSLNPGTAKLVVTGFNLMTLVMDAIVQPPAGPYLILNGCTINDETGNNNGHADYGEQVMLDFAVKNVGINTAPGVTASLSTEDTSVVIVSDQYVYGDIEPDSVVNGSTFTVDISPDIPDMHNVMFSVALWDDSSNTWNTSWVMSVYAPVLDVAFDHIDDATTGNNNGRLDPGETADIVMKGLNKGHAASPDAMLSVTTTCSYATLNTSSYDIGVIEPDTSGEAVINITLSDQTPVGTVIDLTFTLTAGDYFVVVPINLTAGLILEDWESASFDTYEWTFGGDADWEITETLPYEGTYCAQSGNINDNQSSELLITVDVLVDNQISFYKKVSSEAGYDFLTFYIDDNPMGSWSGTVAWSEASYAVTTGTHTLKWEYAKDYYVTSGYDRGWIDYIIFPPISLPVGIATTVRNTSEVKAFPNPVSDILYISYSLDNGSKVRLSILNALGQVIMTEDKGMQNAGSHTMTLNTSGWERGVYYYRFQMGDAATSGKIVKTQ